MVPLEYQMNKLKHQLSARNQRKLTGLQNVLFSKLRQSVTFLTVFYGNAAAQELCHRSFIIMQFCDRK